MRYRILIVSFLVACAARSAHAQNGAAGSDLTAKVRDIPVYPVWESLGHDCADTPPDERHPNATAILVAPGYLVAPASIFRSVTNMSLPETVCVHDARADAVVNGRLVDFELYGSHGRSSAPEAGIVLIKTDTPLSLPPVSLGGGGAPAFTVSFPPSVPLRGLLAFSRVAAPAVGCDPVYEHFHPIGGMISLIKGMLCAEDPDLSNRSLGVFAENGNFLGLIAPILIDRVERRGPDAQHIRAFVEGYFSSWGKYLQEKPQL